MKKTVCAVLALLVLMFGSSVQADTKKQGVVTASVLNVRKGVGRRTQKIGELTKNTNVTILSKKGNWYKIQYGDDTAYVTLEYVSDDPEVIEAANMLSVGEEIVEYAKEFIGVPYVYGGTTPSGFDCSGFVKYVYEKFGISLPRISYDQINVGQSVSEADLQAGDLVFFRGGDHVGIYVGDGQYIHAPRTGRNVTIEPLNRSVYAARRVL